MPAAYRSTLAFPVRSTLDWHQDFMFLSVTGLPGCTGRSRRAGARVPRYDDTCSAAGITKGSFFHHFKGKVELAFSAIEHWSAEDCAAHEQMEFYTGWGIATDQLAALAATL